MIGMLRSAASCLGPEITPVAVTGNTPPESGHKAPPALVAFGAHE